MKGSSRVINGKRFIYLYSREKKADAKKVAEKERKRGWNIRIIKNRFSGKTYYDLYGRKRGRK